MWRLWCSPIWSSLMFSQNVSRKRSVNLLLMPWPRNESGSRNPVSAWWRHQMETFSALLIICAGNSPVTGEFPAQRPVMWSFDIFFYLRLNKRLNKQWWAWWFETPSRPLWLHSNEFLKCWVVCKSSLLIFWRCAEIVHVDLTGDPFTKVKLRHG